MSYQEKLEQLYEAKNRKDPIKKHKCFFCGKKEARQLEITYYGGAKRFVPVCKGHIRARARIEKDDPAEIETIV